MDLSIIIINWNTRKMLKDCLLSIEENKPTVSHEIIVVDNASTDGSQRLVWYDFPYVQLIANTKNIGFAAANNIAMKQASGKMVLLLNSDTLVHGDVLDQSYIYMTKNTDVGLMGCRVLNADGTLQHSTSQFPSLINLGIQLFGLDRIHSVPFFHRYRMTQWSRTTERDVETISGCYMLVRRTCIDSVGMLDDNFFFFGEETDWCKRIRAAGWSVRFAPVGVITHFGGGSCKNLSHKRDLMLTESVVRLHRKHYGTIVALFTFVLQFLFNVSRAVFWRVKALFAPSETAVERGRHFMGVTRNYLSSWPAGKGAKP